MNPQLTALLDAAIEQHHFSGVVDLRRGGQVLYARAAGYADRANQIPNTLATRFGTASGTKFLTALAIGKLIETGRLALDTRLQDCVAVPFPRYAPEITIRHLLTHTAGIPDYYDEEQITDYDQVTLAVPWYALRGPRDYLPAFPAEDMKFAPGDRFSYSNGGYIVLGVVIEEVAGIAYQEFVAREILAPAGMHDSGFFALDQLPERTAHGYIDADGGWRTNVYSLPVVGASDGGMFTTAGDVALLWQAFWRNHILSGELVELFSRPLVRAEKEGLHIYYGLGLWVRDEPGRQTVYVTGCDAGVSFKSIEDRARDLHITVISNTTQGAWPIVREIERALAE
ncbi:MAG TPA: serine hydrolase domain-containing protein [Candidatus Udaeobacter sp.]|nr:serine hydrolase domain-containing protein [Candidatus Udaeobacter sp.]